MTDLAKRKIVTRHGVRHKEAWTWPSRFSAYGKRHVLLWSRDQKRWVLFCRTDDAGISPYNLQDMPGSDSAVDCKRCAHVLDEVFPSKDES